MKGQYVQFSKRIAVAIFAFWAVYRLAVLILSWFKPDILTAMTALQSGVDDVMMVSIGFYTGNSVIEKGIVGYFGRKADSTDTLEESENG